MRIYSLAATPLSSFLGGLSVPLLWCDSPCSTRCVEYLSFGHNADLGQGDITSVLRSLALWRLPIWSSKDCCPLRRACPSSFRFDQCRAYLPTDLRKRVSSIQCASERWPRCAKTEAELGNSSAAVACNFRFVFILDVITMLHQRHRIFQAKSALCTCVTRHMVTSVSGLRA